MPAAPPARDPNRSRPAHPAWCAPWAIISSSCGGPLAQLVEQRTFNPLVTGSSPVRPTIRSALAPRWGLREEAGVAQAPNSTVAGRIRAGCPGSAARANIRALSEVHSDAVSGGAAPRAGSRIQVFMGVGR